MQISIDQCYAKERFWQEYESIKNVTRNDISLATQCNAMKQKEKSFPNNVTRDSVMQISTSVMLKRDFGGNMNI